MDRVIGIDARYGLRKNRRGIGNYIYHLLCEFCWMRPAGFKFILYADGTADPGVVEEFRQDSFTVQVLPAPNLVWWEQVALPLAARRDEVDLLHCTSNIAPVLLKSCRLVTTIHDVIEFRRREFGDTRLTFRHRLSRTYRMGVLPRVARLSDLIITDSEFSRRDIATVLNVQPEKIKTIYIATSRRKSGRNPKWAERLKELGINGEYIFALGAVDRRKNTARLLEAYRRLRAETGTRIQLVVAGIEKPDIFAPLAGEGVWLFGFLPDEVIGALYEHALFFVYPSLYEGFGLPILEAMASGTPVLCSATTAVGEIAGDAALKCNPADVEDIAAKMKVLLEDAGLRKQLIEQGYRRAEKFSWERCARETLQVYREVLGG
ncbi:glycosyltransferase family 4 protein [Desulfovirgula thermocuniculi]|uniref:glycosyltransferase family 4 protein n=1 Tax=Desulfovirgula thermocuniculi TaxID=348842 RepID=UPI00040FFC3C|nr:glycosyltransferase family 1 protein [Desulfovirgula thermocuniculi]